MIKKEYMAPELEAIEMKVRQMLCESSGETEGGSGALDDEFGDGGGLK